jgi:hypothetical protein
VYSTARSNSVERVASAVAWDDLSAARAGLGGPAVDVDVDVVEVVVLILLSLGGSTGVTGLVSRGGKTKLNPEVAVGGGGCEAIVVNSLMSLAVRVLGFSLLRTGIGSCTVG